MPRKRSISDQDLLDGALAVLRRTGPDGVTFAAVAAETGLAAPTLVQRFGSKAALLKAALLRAWDLLDAATAAADAAHAKTPAGAGALLADLSRGYGDGNAFAEGLLVLREDLRDADLRRRGVLWGERLAAALGSRLASDDRQPASDLGRLMAAQWQGALIWWSFGRDGDVVAALTSELEAWCAAMGLAGRTAPAA